MKRFIPLIAIAFAAALLLFIMFAAEDRSPVSFEDATMVCSEPPENNEAR